MRNVIGELLGFLTLEETEAALTQLADAVLGHLVRGTGILAVALGKYGGGELGIGSDLDLMFVADEGEAAAAAAAVERVREVLHHGGPLGPAYPVDLRLRPHGDAGAVVATLGALAAYHGFHDAGPQSARAGGGQTWERQVLVRARVVAGPSGLAARFRDWVGGLLYSRAASPEEEAEMWAMRARIERERDAVLPPERAFKTGAGGLVDVEFLVQALQMRHGHASPALRAAGTRPALEALAAAGIVPAGAAATLLDNHRFLKRIEFSLRRDAHRGVSVMAATPAERLPLARWMGFPDEAAFWAAHTGRLRETRAIVLDLGGPPAKKALGP
jgi:glutamate-ammonia-ligase adenylyltransferase